MQRQMNVSFVARIDDKRLRDQGIDDRIGDARDINGARQTRRFRAEIGAHRLARRQPESEARGDDVIIEIVGALLVLRRIDDAEARGDAEQIEVPDEGRGVRLQPIVEIEEFDLERLAVRQKQARILPLAARREEQIVGLAQQRAVLPRSVGHRRYIGLVEDGRQHLLAEGLEDLQLFRRRLS